MLQTPQEIAESEVVSFEDLKGLGGGEGPCVTVAVAIANPAQIRPIIHNVLDDIKKSMKEHEIRVYTDLVEPIRTLAAGIEERGEWSKNLILFRSPNVFRYFSLRELKKQFVTVEDRFQIRPLLGLLSRSQRFYLLSLSQKHVRLFQCTYHSAEELGWRGLAAENMDAWMNTRQPDHVLDGRASSGPSVGSMKGVLFGTSTDGEKEGEYMAHYFRHVDQALEKLLLDRTIPLVLAGVETEIAIYRKVNRYPRLMERAVLGAPDSIPLRDLREAAVEIVTQVPSPELRQALDQLERYSGTGRVSVAIEETLKAAWEGRVAHLIVQEDAERRGIVDDGRDRSEEDLLNRAALETASRGGHVFALPAAEMPANADAVAVLRF